jgi:hypothetical protein
MLRLRHRHDDYGVDAFDVVSAHASVGIIKKAPLGDHWIWIFTAFDTSPKDRGPSWGSADTRDEALDAFTERWRDWCAWAGLAEIERSEDRAQRTLEVDARKLLGRRRDRPAPKSIGAA